MIVKFGALAILVPRFSAYCVCRKPWDNQLLCTKNFGACGGSTAVEKVLIRLYCARSGFLEFLIISMDILQFDCLLRFDTACDIFIYFECGLTTYLASNFPFTSEL